MRLSSMINKGYQSTSQLDLINMWLITDKYSQFTVTHSYCCNRMCCILSRFNWLLDHLAAFLVVYDLNVHLERSTDSSANPARRAAQKLRVIFSRHRRRPRIYCSVTLYCRVASPRHSAVNSQRPPSSSLMTSSLHAICKLPDKQ